MRLIPIKEQFKYILLSQWHFLKKELFVGGINQNNETFQLFNRAYLFDNTNKTIVMTFAVFFIESAQ